MKRIPHAFCLLLLCLIAPLHAQDTTLSGKLTGLFTFGVCGRPLCLDGSVNAANGHGDHFLPDLATGNAAILGFITNAIGVSTSSIPTTASASGITYRFEGGLPVKTSASEGPIFADRAQTLGRGRLMVGARYSSATFKTLRGVPIDNIQLNFTHQDVPPAGLGNPLLENDVMQTKLSLNLGLEVTSVFATYGVSNGLDLSVVVPMVHSSLQATADAEIMPFGSTAVHFFSGTPENPVLDAHSAAFGSHTGLGDVAFRAKGTLHSGEQVHIGVLGDLRVPTGDADNFAGAGSASLRAQLLASARFGVLTSHLNVGYLLRGGNDFNDEIVGTAGFDQPLSDWATMAGEVVTEWQVGANKVILPGTVTYVAPFHRTVEPTNIPDTKDNRVLAAFGMKFRTAERGPILTANALIPVVRGGLQPTVLWTFGVDFGAGR